MRLLVLTVLALPALALAQTPKTDADKAESAGDPQNRMICKRFTEIGSLIASHKICKTKREWDGERAAMRLGNTSGQCPGGAAGASGGNC